MKLKLYDRIMMSVISVLLTALGMITFLVPFMYQEANTAPMKFIFMAGGVLILISGCVIWMLNCKYQERKKDYIVQQNECGPMRISVKAVEDLVQKCVDTHEEVKEDKISIVNGRDGVRVDLAVSLPNNISIPLAVDNLQKHVKNYLKASSGIDVTAVRISVNTTKGEIASDVALDVAQQAESVSSAPAAPETTKKESKREIRKPAHQRIFGRSKQEIETEAREALDETAEKAEEVVEEAAQEVAQEAAPAEEVKEAAAEVVEIAQEIEQAVPATEEPENKEA